MDEDQEIYFRRFDKQKQDQVRQLVSYITLLDLSADDLISIGNRLKRVKISEEVRINKALAKDLYQNVSIINYQFNNLVFTLDYNDTIFKFKFGSWYNYTVNIENKSTKLTKNFNVKTYNVGSGVRGKVMMVLVNIKNGDIVLDF